jgi:hypothetical protein
VRLEAPEWEYELWSCLGECNGCTCPVYDRCPIRRSGGWCLSDNRQHLERLLDSTQFDPHDYDFFDQITPGRIFRLIEQTVQRYLKMASVVSPPVPTEVITMFGKKEAIEIREVPLKVCSGATWHTDDGWVIHLNAHETPAEKRFTLFHEVFHILSHREARRLPWQGRRKKGIFCELLADYFSKCVLMPRQWVAEKWAELEDLDRMAEAFGVPRRAMWVKLRSLNLIGQTYRLT